MNFFLEPWPWYLAGTGIALVLFLLIMMGKTFGLSSNFRTLCAACQGGKHVPFFNYDWKNQKWNLWVVAGVILGSFIAVQFLEAGQDIIINPKTLLSLQSLGFSGEEYLPHELFSWHPKSIFLLAIAGLLIGFGTRYAGGCTSGHAITGLSNLQIPSLIAVIGFFIGGLIMVHIIFPFIF